MSATVTPLKFSPPEVPEDKDKSEKIIVTIVWPAPLMTPFEINATAKKI